MKSPNAESNAEAKSSEESNNEEVTSIKFDVFGHLPQKLAQQILFELSPKDLRLAASCCRTWKAAIRNNDNFWEKLCERECYWEVNESKRTEFYKKFLNKYNHWEGVYWYWYTLHQNWKTNNFGETIYYIRGPTNYGNWWFLDEVFVINSVPGTKLYVYNFKGDHPTVCSMMEDDEFHIDHVSQNENYLFHFISEVMLIVWDIKKASIILNELWDHVINIHPYKNLIVLETSKEKLQVYNIETKEIEYECKGIFTNVAFMDGRLVFTAVDHVIHILKWEDKSLVILTCCNESDHHNLLVDKDLLLSFCKKKKSSDVTLCLWNIVTKTKLHSTLLRCSYDLDNASLVNKYLYLKGRNNIGCNKDDFVDLWDYTKRSLVALINNVDLTTRLINNYFMIASHSSKLGLWCLKTGDFLYDFSFFNVSQTQSIADVAMTETKVVYAKQTKDGAILLHIRDFEI